MPPPPVDYSFMRTGHSMLKGDNDVEHNLNPDDEDTIMSLLTIFSSNAILNASKYGELCERNGITNQDMKNGLIFEVFEFTKRDNLKDELEEIKEKYKNGDYDSDSDWEDLDDEVPGNNYIIADSDLSPYSRIESLEHIDCKDKDFVIKYHNYIDNWDTWIPSNPIETIMKNAINKINI